MVLELWSIKILKKDLDRLDKLRLHKTEPRWSIIERLIKKELESHG